MTKEPTATPTPLAARTVQHLLNQWQATWLSAQVISRDSEADLARRIKTFMADNASIGDAGCEWMLIESAPVNESVLVYIPNAEHYGAGIYRAIKNKYDKTWSTFGMSVGRACGDRQPTHWMPLPAPPEGKESK